jgi:hypothetical protein
VVLKVALAREGPQKFFKEVRSTPSTLFQTFLESTH